jgi:predicted membrane protein
VILLLMLTVVGIPFALLLLAAWILVQALAGVMSAYYLGRKIWRRQRNPVLIMLVGSVLLIILYFIPFVGFIALVAALLLGTGMLLQELKRRRPTPNYRVESRTPAPTRATP